MGLYGKTLLIKLINNLKILSMKKVLMFFAGIIVPGILMAGGLVTNTNHSAAWVRLPARNASTDIDAVYYNPAGLMKLQNGFHISLSNQTIFQTREVENFYKGPGGAFGLNNNLFTGTVKTPLFPGIYAAYKTERLAFSIGFNPIGGGGGAEYNDGLPSFEMGPSDLVPALATSQGVSDYRLDAYLKGSSVYFGLQAGVSFKVNEWLSVAAGLRYVMAKNTYEGHLQDIELLQGANWVRADLIMTNIANAAKAGGDGLTPLISGGAGGLTPAQAATAGIITTAQRDAIVNGLVSLGVSNASTLTISQCQTAYYGAQAKYNLTATLLNDQEVDVEQTGSGFAPFFSVNISPSENLNIAVKYEMKTSMQLKNKTTKDFLIGYTNDATPAPITMFPDGDETPADMPAMLSAGIDYRLSDALKVSLGGNYFFDKSADYGRKLDLDNNPSTPSVFVKNKDIIDFNGWSANCGLELKLSEKLLVSGGYILSNKGVNEKYQSDLTFGLATHTFGAGGAYKIMDNLTVNAGASYTLYVKDEKMTDHVFSATGVLFKAKETYLKNTLVFGLGVDYSF